MFLVDRRGASRQRHARQGLVLGTVVAATGASWPYACAVMNLRTMAESAIT
jgi:hypothetical protein